MTRRVRTSRSNTQKRGGQIHARRVLFQLSLSSRYLGGAAAGGGLAGGARGGGGWGRGRGSPGVGPGPGLVPGVSASMPVGGCGGGVPFGILPGEVGGVV